MPKQVLIKKQTIYKRIHEQYTKLLVYLGLEPNEEVPAQNSKNYIEERSILMFRVIFNLFFIDFTSLLLFAL